MISISKTRKYLIGEFAQLVGLSAYTLRYYEQEKLIIPHRDHNHRRYYTDHDIHWVGFLLHLKGTGMTMHETKKYVHLRSMGDTTIPQRMALLKDVRANSLARINEMRANLKILSHKIDWYEGKENHKISESFNEYLKKFQN